MRKDFKKKLSFLLISFFVFSYEFANPVANQSYRTVEASATHTVILGGQSIGVNINIDGIMVLGVSEFYGDDGKKHCPAKDAGIKEGDVIISVNNKKITSATEFSNLVDTAEGENISIEYTRENKKNSTYIVPVKSSEDGKYRLGLWARDGTTGIGTLTFVDPETKKFGALGHGVADADTEKLIKGKGSIYFSYVNGIKKSTSAQPGELQGYFVSTEIGDISSNTECGIFGNFYESQFTGNQIPIASKNEISTGSAKIFCCINGNKVEEFSINIEKININSKDNKSMVIKITDEKLINCTGGIVQGMSGSPIVQNGKLIGAVTHVFVNDSTKGYGVFIENMTDNMKDAKL